MPGGVPLVRISLSSFTAFCQFSLALPNIFSASKLRLSWTSGACLAMRVIDTEELGRVEARPTEPFCSYIHRHPDCFLAVIEVRIGARTIFGVRGREEAEGLEDCR